MAQRMLRRPGSSGAAIRRSRSAASNPAAACRDRNQAADEFGRYSKHVRMPQGVLPLQGTPTQRASIPGVALRPLMADSALPRADVWRARGAVARSCGGGGANGIVTALAGMQSPQGATPTKPRAEPHARSECCAALGHRAQPSVGRGVRPPTRRPPAETEIRPRMNSGGTRNMCACPMVSCPFRAPPRRGHRFPGWHASAHRGLRSAPG